MKIVNVLKHLGLACLVLTVAVGCASMQQEEKAAKPAAEEKGPSAAEQAIARAKAALDKAASVGGEWRDSRKILKKAQAALKDGDEAKAVKLAKQAESQGELGYAQALEEQRRFQERLAREAAEAAAQADSYDVVNGDSLWRISGKSEIYADPYQWPLIYKANRSQIKDADLIYPGQKLSIDRAASSGEIARAIQHAKTRGAWSLGVQEESDRAYLEGN